MKIELIQGLKELMDLCSECIGEIEVSVESDRACDILATDIPEKSNALFEAIFFRGDSSVGNINEPLKDELG